MQWKKGWLTLLKVILLMRNLHPSKVFCYPCACFNPTESPVLQTEFYSHKSAIMWVVCVSDKYKTTEKYFYSSMWCKWVTPSTEQCVWAVTFRVEAAASSVIYQELALGCRQSHPAVCLLRFTWYLCNFFLSLCKGSPKTRAVHWPVPMFNSRCSDAVFLHEKRKPETSFTKFWA